MKGHNASFLFFYFLENMRKVIIIAPFLSGTLIMVPCMLGTAEMSCFPSPGVTYMSRRKCDHNATVWASCAGECLEI